MAEDFHEEERFFAGAETGEWSYWVTVPNRDPIEEVRAEVPGFDTLAFAAGSPQISKVLEQEVNISGSTPTIL